jgi:hypothetical protein
MRDSAEFWEELLAQIEAAEIIPIVGPELLTVTLDGQEIPLYQVVAERLLSKYGAAGSVPLRRYHELNDAVSALVQRGRRVQDLYRPINDIVRTMGESLTDDSLRPLRDLARISGLRVFVSTTPDDWLTRAIDLERHAGRARTDAIVFAPKLASGTLADLPESPSSAYTAVCHLFGKASPSPFVFAIHDEDTLEFIHNLQLNGAEGMKRLISALRQRNLLLIGCNFADWLGRFFIRVANTQRLADNRVKREFLIERSAEGEGSLTLFLERFSPDTWVFPGNARDFVAELSRRWAERHPENQASAAPVPEAAPPRARVEETVFVSYSRTDAAAARQLFGELDELGVDVAWFDKSALKPGDGWEQTIRDAIGGCYLFLPLVSANTELRDEGFFREEWMLASQRSRRIQGRKFIIPVVIDTSYDGDAGRFRLVPDSFASAQFGHAPDGRLSAELLDEIRRLIRERRSHRPT